MLKAINVLLAVATLSAAGTLYRIKADTRRLDAEVHALERQAEHLESEIAHLTAERAHLVRPERLEPAARALGLLPLRPSQIAPPTTGSGR